MTKNNIQIISCSSNEALSQEISGILNIPLTKKKFDRFNDGEIFFKIEENVRGNDVFVIQPTNSPANDNLMELLIMLDALKRASASRITAVIPYFGYARQDRKTEPRTPISAKLVANLLEVAGADRVLTMDLHAAQIQGFFNIPTDNLFASASLINDIEKHVRQDSPLQIISPDVGGVARARAIAKRLNCDLAIVDKRREKAGMSEVMNIIGNVSGCDCILYDDMIDTAGTMCNAAHVLKERGALRIFAYASHGVFSHPAIERIDASPIEKVVVTNSIETSQAAKNCKKLRHVSVAPLLADAIMRIHENASISVLFDD